VTLPSLQDFAAHVAGDPALRDKLRAAVGPEEVVRIAAEQGHAICKEDLLQAHADAVAAAPQQAPLNSWWEALEYAFGISEDD
jgi:predicted ribosomally synthesized peptide with nif11-like leader